MKNGKKVLTFGLVLALIFSCIPSSVPASAAKKVSLSAKKLTMTVGNKKTIQVKNYKGKAKLKWSINKKLVKLKTSGTKNTRVQITAKKVGTVKLTVKVSGKKYTCTIKIKKKQDNTQATTAPVVVQTPVPTAPPVVAQTPSPTVVPTPVPTYAPKDMSWWLNDRFGMFIHFGSYSYYGQGEWAMQTQGISKETYQTTISSKFNPVNFDADEIVSEAKSAGMKYITITAKHHEGLAMWDTKVDSFRDYTGEKIFSLQQYTPFGSMGRDILMELKNACDAAGIKFCLYYSIIDWNHPSQVINSNFTKMSSMQAREDYIRDMEAQLKELVDLYDPAVLWFDGDWLNYSGEPTEELWWTKQDGQNLYDYVRSLDPQIIVNERVCRGFGLGDFECPEQEIPSSPRKRPWETNQTMNGAWGYDESKENSYKSASEMIRELPDVVSKGGNYLLNIGPKGDGTITDGSKTILAAFGEWMEKNGESIYGNTQSPFANKPAWGAYTQKGNTIYVHLFKSLNQITVESYTEAGPKKVTALASGKELDFTMNNGKVVIDVPAEVRDSSDTVIAMEY